MIVACHACPSQYSVPDAKVRGKKVRITCKHCKSPIIIDGMSLVAGPDVVPPSAQPKFQPPPPLEVQSPELARQDDLTLIARAKFGQGLSVHDEPTVIGQIPREALDYERAFAQRTQPPPSDDARAAPAPVANLEPAEPPLPRFPSGRPSALPEVPGNPEEDTKRASPQGFARSEPPTGQFVPAALPPVPAPPRPQPPTVVIKETRDEPTLVSSDLSALSVPAASLPQPRSPVLRAALMLLALALVSFLILKLR